MSDDLAGAPTTGGGGDPAPASNSSATSAPMASDTGKGETGKSAESRATSRRDAIDRAFVQAQITSPNETEQAAAVLKSGPGSDDALVKERAEAAEETERASEASERAKRGWETRKANAERAASEARQEGEAQVDANPDAAPQSQFKTPPQRFAREAQAEWDKVPESVRAEIDRSHRELEQGIAKYKTDAEKYAEFATYEAMSQQAYGQPLKATLENYIQLDQLLSTDPLVAFEKLANAIPYKNEDGTEGRWTLKQLAQYVVSQDRDTFDDPQSDLRRELESVRRELATLKSGVTEREQQRAQQEQMSRTRSLETQIADFAKANPRFDELSSAIEVELHNPRFHPELQADPIRRLQKAYEKAERLNPAKTISPPAPDVRAPDPAAQTRRGSASITGAPGSGSNPVARGPAPKSTRDAVDAAFSRFGIG